MNRRVVLVLGCTFCALVVATVWVPGEYGRASVEPVPVQLAKEVRARFDAMTDVPEHERVLAEARWWGTTLGRTADGMRGWIDG